MLTLYKRTTATVFLTLAEKATLPLNNFLFVFRARSPGVEKAVVLQAMSNNSRCERFDIDVSAVFGDAPEGQYLYTVYEQEDDTNLNPSLAGRKLEEGIAMLHPDAAFQYTQTAAPTTYIQPQ